MNGEYSASARRVDFARGQRSYIHTLDLIRTAPISPSDTGFQFRFQSLVQHPGEWIEAGSVSETSEVKATARIDAETGSRHYSFICPDNSMPLERHADFTFQFNPSNVALQGDILKAPLQAGVAFWEQLIETTRYGGEVLFQNSRWYIVSVSGNPACMTDAPPNSTLTLRLVSHRARLNLMRFETDYGVSGQIMTTPA